MLSGVWGGGLASVLDVQSFSFYYRKLDLYLYIIRTIVNFNVRGQFCFCFDFVRLHARCGCCSIVCLHFQFARMKQVDCKMSTKNMNNYK